MVNSRAHARSIEDGDRRRRRRRDGRRLRRGADRLAHRDVLRGRAGERRGRRHPQPVDEPVRSASTSSRSTPARATSSSATRCAPTTGRSTSTWARRSRSTSAAEDYTDFGYWKVLTPVNLITDSVAYAALSTLGVGRRGEQLLPARRPQRPAQLGRGAPPERAGHDERRRHGLGGRGRGHDRLRRERHELVGGQGRRHRHERDALERQGVRRGRRRHRRERHRRTPRTPRRWTRPRPRRSSPGTT